MFCPAMDEPMKKSTLGIIFGWTLAWLLAWPGAACAMELPAGLLAKLQSEEFRQREQGQGALLEWARQQPARAVTDELLRLSASADDPEVRDRCLRVLRDLVHDEYLLEGEGYMGIRMLDELANVPGDPRPRSVIRVIQEDELEDDE